MASFVKMLTESDANHNLTVPCSILPHVNGGDGGELRAMDDHTGIIYEFFLSTNINISSLSSSSNGKQKQFYKKPILQSQGWLEFVKDKLLQVGDTIYFWKDDDGLFRIEALLLNSMAKDSNEFVD
ncbi:hypothetical protein FNV43_RR14135 [Rhamnella rubrinervis]|uniref:TF-B3 domain-containing protein n=1 Tax=Rhamnella rubrinervis TaxID=2594499 RepID=A0A8K0MG52_9ROSA|nr:hypothetical protein FNV43_RR14135 [Rhamnella rubrinervis]